MKFISLFAGVGGFDEGMRRAGHEVCGNGGVGQVRCGCIGVSLPWYTVVLRRE